MKTKKTRVNCGACAATGVYQGMAESVGEGKVCLDCKAKGYVLVAEVVADDTVFTERKTRSGITYVTLASTKVDFIGGGPQCEPVSYAEFLEGKLPKKVEHPKAWRAFGSEGEITGK